MAKKSKFRKFLELLYGLRTTPATLIFANLIPLFGILFLGWNVFFLLALYSIENVIRGVIFVLKMIVVRNQLPEKEKSNLESVGFFIFHYGGFCLAHSLFILGLFGPGRLPNSNKIILSESIQALLNQPLFWIAVGVVFIHHYISHRKNFISAGDYSIKMLARHLPYGRMLALHMALLFGGALVLKTGEPVWAVAVLAMLKTALELVMHTEPSEQLKTDA